MVVIRVENYRHLNGFDIALIYLVLADWELFDAEVIPEGLGDLIAANLADVAVEKIKFNHAIVL